MSYEEQNQVIGAYTHLAEYLEERINIMQWWSDYLDYSRNNAYIPHYQFKQQQANEYNTNQK